jgi:hypothetical protein
VVLCWDHPHYWRKEKFPYYKKHRQKTRDDSDLDFHKFFEYMDVLQTEIRETVPFTSLKSKYLEADDWIAILSKNFSEMSEEVRIISTDGDFHQLQKYKGVTQYNHVRRELINVPKSDVVNLLKVKVICGDPGDGIPNVFSDDDTFVCEEKRQKRFGEKKAWDVVLSTTDLHNWAFKNDILNKYKRNDMLINFDLIPEEIRTGAYAKYLEISQKNKYKDSLSLMAYFNSKKLNKLSFLSNDFFI